MTKEEKWAEKNDIHAKCCVDGIFVNNVKNYRDKFQCTRIFSQERISLQVVVVVVAAIVSGSNKKGHWKIYGQTKKNKEFPFFA